MRLLLEDDRSPKGTRKAPLNLILEMEIGITGGVEDLRLRSQGCRADGVGVAVLCDVLLSQPLSVLGVGLYSWPIAVWCADVQLANLSACYVLEQTGQWQFCVPMSLQLARGCCVC